MKHIEEDRPAEEFAEEMHAEPKELDGESGLATPEEQAAAETLGEEPLADAADAQEPVSQGPEIEQTETEREAQEFADEMHAEPKELDGEPGLATAEEQTAAEALGEEPFPDPLAETTAPLPEPKVESVTEAEEDSAVAEPPEPDSPGPDLEPETETEREAEEFAGEMHAEPKDLDGEPGLATPEEQAAAEALGEEPVSQSGARDADALSPDEILGPDRPRQSDLRWPAEDAELMAMLEAVIYITDEPLTLDQITNALGQSRERIKRLLDELVAEWLKPQHGLAIREVAGGYKMATKPEHHDAVRQFVKSLKPPMKLSLPALETLAVIAYKQPCTGPEIMEIRGVQGASVLKTLIDRKLIAPAGRKNVIGKPILYKTTKEFLVQFGLKDLSELPSVKEFEELARFAVETEPAPAPAPERPAPPSPQPTDAAVPGETEPELRPEAEAQPAEQPPAAASEEEPIA